MCCAVLAILIKMSYYWYVPDMAWYRVVQVVLVLNTSIIQYFIHVIQLDKVTRVRELFNLIWYLAYHPSSPPHLYLPDAQVVATYEEKDEENGDTTHVPTNKWYTFPR